MTTAEPKRFLTVPEAASIVGLSLRHFRRTYYDEGNGRVTKIRHKIFIMRQDLERWISENRSPKC